MHFQVTFDLATDRGGVDEGADVRLDDMLIFSHSLGSESLAQAFTACLRDPFLALFCAPAAQFGKTPPPSSAHTRTSPKLLPYPRPLPHPIAVV